MKLLVLIGFLCIAGFVNASVLEKFNSNEKRKVLRRAVRSALGGMSDTYLLHLEAAIISNCKKNGHQDVATSLQDTYDDMKVCLKRKRLFLTPKNEFLSNIDECSRDAVKKTKQCLGEDQKYFPEFILDLVKSVASFMYDDTDYLRNDVAPCMSTLNSYTAQRKYIQCLTDSSTQTHDTNQIPTSKASFCQKFIPASYCFTDMLKENCDRSEGLDKFRSDYINAMKQPCDKKEI